MAAIADLTADALDLQAIFYKDSQLQPAQERRATCGLQCNKLLGYAQT